MRHAQAPRLSRDLTAGLSVYLVALPLCLGVALASDAPLASGLVSGILGGIVVGLLSGSQTSVAGPAAGLTAVVASLILQLGSFQAFLVAVLLAGLFQIALGLIRAGSIASFFPSSVIKGLLAGIGVILVLKQIPHVFGYDADPEGEMAFRQPDGENTFSELIRTALNVHAGAALIGVASIVLLVLWSRSKRLSRGPIPAPLIVVGFGMLANEVLKQVGGGWVVGTTHLVQVPMLESVRDGARLLAFPDWAALSNPAVYVGAATLAIVASLETLLNLDAVDQIDPEQRHSPPNRELIAQGVGNVVAGLIGGLPMTSVIVRSSVNIGARNATKLSTILHGVLMLGSVLLVPALLNTIPLASLAAILLITGVKLASPALMKQMLAGGRQQALPFLATVLTIAFVDLLSGVLVGLVVAIGFILWSNFRRPLRVIKESHLSGDVVRIELANQVSFLNRAALDRALREAAPGTHMLLDATDTDYIDPDILDLIHDFEQKMAPAHQIGVSLVGFRDDYPRLADRINFVDYTTREMQAALSPTRLVEMLAEGNRRFRDGHRITRDFRRQVEATAPGQAPLAVVLSCVDSRTPPEHIFDLGIGDIFGVRIAGNVAGTNALGSIEFGCKVAGARLVVVMGHTACGAVTSAVQLALEGKAASSTNLDNITSLMEDIHVSMGARLGESAPNDDAALSDLIDDTARRHVLRTMTRLTEASTTLATLVAADQVAIVGALYDVRSGEVTFLGGAAPTPDADAPESGGASAPQRRAASTAAPELRRRTPTGA